MAYMKDEDGRRLDSFRVAERDPRASQAFGGLPLITYGHSFLAEQGLSDPKDYWARRLARALGMVYPTLRSANDMKRAVGGSRVEEAAQRLVGTAAPWVAGTRGLAVIEALINTARLHGIDAAGIAGARHAIRAMCAVISSARRIENTDAMFTYAGPTVLSDPMWSAGSVTAFTQVTFTTPAANCWVLTNARRSGLSGVTLTVTNESDSGSVITTYVNQNLGASDTVGNYSPAVILLNVPAGTNVKITATGSGVAVLDAILVPDPAPTPILLMKEPYLGDYSYSTSFPNGSDAALDSFNAVLDDVAAEFPNVIVANPNTAGYWQKSLALPGVTGALVQTDGVHPSSAGNDALAKTALDALKLGIPRYASWLGASVARSGGDTGWRNVSSLLQNGWAGTVYMRRRSTETEVRFAGLDGTSATSNVVMDLGLFAPESVAARGLLTKTDSSAVLRTTVNPFSSDRNLLATASAGPWYGTMRWSDTYPVWPTSLPGTAV